MSEIAHCPRFSVPVFQVTSKYQVTLPKAITDEFNIRPGEDIHWVAAGEMIRVISPGIRAVTEDRESRLRLFDQATERLRRPGRGVRTSVHGRFPEKQKIAMEILRRGIAEDSVRIPHHAIVEFVAAVTRTLRTRRNLHPRSSHDRLYGTVRAVNPFVDL